VLLDAITGGANLFWPVYDQFYEISGRLELSSQRGIVQTFVESGGDGDIPTPDAIGDSSEIQASTGVDPNPGGDTPSDEPVDRIFPIARGGWELYILVIGTLATATRFVVGYDVQE
jgi:hypothetical protein